MNSNTGINDDDDADTQESSTSRNFIKPSKEEMLYRKKHFKNFNVTDDEHLKYLTCTSCKLDVKGAVLNGKKVPHHPMLRVLFCKKCRDYYEDGEFSMDEDGTDKYCRWCGKGDTLFCCVKCPYAFCSKCITQHFGSDQAKKVKNDEHWKCLFCNPKPLWFLRAICFAAKIESKKIREDFRSGRSKKKETEVNKAAEGEKKKAKKADSKKAKEGPEVKKKEEVPEVKKKEEVPEVKRIKKAPDANKFKDGSEINKEVSEIYKEVSEIYKEGSVEKELNLIEGGAEREIKEKRDVCGTPEARPSSSASDAATVIFDHNDPDVDLVVSSSLNNNNDTNYVNTNISNNNNTNTNSNNTPVQLEAEAEPEPEPVKKRRKSSEKESNSDEVLKRKRKNSNTVNGLNKGSSESGIENSNDSSLDFSVLSKFAKRDLEDMYTVTRMTTNLCDKLIEKRLDKIKYVKTYKQYCKEYSKIVQIAQCLKKNLDDIERVAVHTRQKLQDSFSEENCSFEGNF